MNGAQAWALLLAALGLAGLAAVSLWRRRNQAKRMRSLEQALATFCGGLEGGDFETATRDLGSGPWRAQMERLARVLQERLAKAEQAQGHLATALNGMHEGVALCGPGGRVLLMNPAFRRLAGAAPPEGRPYTLREALRDPELDRALEGALNRGQEAQVDLPLDGGRREGRALVTPLASGSAVVLLFDRTEERKVERLRSEFVANVSHELRTPLAAIKASLETLADGALDDPAVNRSFLEKAVRHAERLEELLGDLLTLSQIEDQRRQGRAGGPARCSAPEAWADAEPLLEPALRRSGVRVQAVWPAALPALAMERAALRQILVNFVDNALKHSGASQPIEVGARALEGSVEVHVRDQGQGIPPADQARVFERFYRVDKARTRAQGGSGLGLAIVKHLAENAGGSVGVDSRPGQGSRFWVRVPVAQD